MNTNTPVVENKAWFESWFDSPYYHLLYRHRNMQDARLLINKLIEALPLLPQHKILDLACGKGRHAIYLNECGLDVIGADLSPQNISHASQHENERLQFRVHDMRRTLKKEFFDVVLNLFTSFGYFDSDAENQQAVVAAASNLKPGGLLLIDFLNVRQVVARLRPAETQEHEGVLFRIQRRVENGYILKDIELRDGEVTQNYQERVRALELADFQRYFEAAGLTLRQSWGDYHLAPFQSETSERLILLAQK